MIIKHKTHRKYVYGGGSMFNILGNLVSKIASKTPEMIAKTTANALVNKVTKEVVKQGEKALLDSLGKTVGKKTINSIIKKTQTAKKNIDAIMTNLATNVSNENEVNLNSLISGMGLRKVLGWGITLD